MKQLLIGLIALASLSSYADSKLSCDVLNPEDNYTVEVHGNKAAFFDNDNWTHANFKWVLESTVPYFVYESVYGKNDFVIELRATRDDKPSTTGTIKVKIGSRFETYALSCKEVKKLIFLK